MKSKSSIAPPPDPAPPPSSSAVTTATKSGESVGGDESATAEQDAATSEERKDERLKLAVQKHMSQHPQSDLRDLMKAAKEPLALGMGKLAFSGKPGGIDPLEIVKERERRYEKNPNID